MATENLLKLDNLKRRFGYSDAKILRALKLLSKSKSADGQSLIRFHETLLFFRAYPQSARVLHQVENILKTFGKRVLQLRESGEDLTPLDDPEVSGLTGTSVTSNFSYRIVRWLVEKYPRQVSIDWDSFTEEDRFGAQMPRFLPLLEEDALVEAHVPYREWLDEARGRVNELGWIIARFESLSLLPARYPDEPGLRTSLPYEVTAEAYDSLKLNVTWKFSNRASRTAMKLPVRKVFFHRQPLIQRREISLATELASPEIKVARISRAAGEKILDMARETSAVRYRELHGFTYGDASRVLKAHLGRGVDIFVMGVPPQHRLPLRAYHAALIFKNGVPVAYFEGLSIFERMESGFNLYYTFRDGETAWIFARVLRLMNQLLGVTVFSIDPYQVGHKNEEGIESGAFWFYRKLGFRPVRPSLLKLAQSEERRMAADSMHRTPARTLRKLAAGHMLFEMTGARSGKWDRFLVRNIGLAVQRRMAHKFAGEAHKMRRHSNEVVACLLGLKPEDWREAEQAVFESQAIVLAMIPDIDGWNPTERKNAAIILEAKARGNEARYLRLMQKHARLREAVIKLGS